MNDKDLVLKILDKHRDMSLTMGCEVYWNGYKQGFTRVFMGYSEEIDYGTKYAHIVSTDYEFRKGKKWSSCITKTEMLTVIGHPATPLTLLKALGEKHSYVMEANGDHIYIRALQGIHLPLTTTLTELPHTHQLWTDLLPILS